MPPGAGCAVLAFDWGDGGFMAYASNAKREDMIRALRELLERFEGGTENTAGRS
jgi:hypothetical protein